MKKIKEPIKIHHHDCKTAFISSPILSSDNMYTYCKIMYKFCKQKLYKMYTKFIQNLYKMYFKFSQKFDILYSYKIKKTMLRQLNSVYSMYTKVT